jgi:O-methyltransferase involved in polyketide biosynthesis
MTAGAATQLRSKNTPTTHRPADRKNSVTPNLSGVSETMLWSLYGRACEARRPVGILVDPDSLRICEAIDYDFVGHFGQPIGSLAARAVEIDNLLRRWLKHHPDGLIVSLGEGLETQSRRVDNGRMRWLSVDVPAAMELREHFLIPTDRFHHVASSALDLKWMGKIEPSTELFIVAQGLFMYLEPEAVSHLLVEITKRFPGAEMAFDVIPRWFSRLTLWGLMQTPRYRLPPMPWGINRDEIESGLRKWSSRIGVLDLLDYRVPYGWPKLFEDFFRLIPPGQNELPCLVHAVIRDA